MIFIKDPIFSTLKRINYYLHILNGRSSSSIYPTKIHVNYLGPQPALYKATQLSTGSKTMKEREMVTLLEPSLNIYLHCSVLINQH